MSPAYKWEYELMIKEPNSDPVGRSCCDFFTSMLRNLWKKKFISWESWYWRLYLLQITNSHVRYTKD
jgi:hypothetical protein